MKWDLSQYHHPHDFTVVLLPHKIGTITQPLKNHSTHSAFNSTLLVVNMIVWIYTSCLAHKTWSNSTEVVDPVHHSVIIIFSYNVTLWMTTDQKTIRPYKQCRTPQSDKHFAMIHQIPFNLLNCEHNDVIKWKQFPHYWHFVQGIHRSHGGSSIR